MASKPLDIVARFRTVTTEFNTRQIEKELDDADRAFDKSNRRADRWSRDIDRSADKAGKGAKGRLGNVGSEVAEEFSQNFGEAIRSGNPFQAILETATSLGPALGLAGLATAAGAGIILGIVNGINDNKAKIKAAAEGVWEAYRDGTLDAQESQDIVVKALGLETWEEAVPRITELAKQAGVSPRLLYQAILTGKGPVVDALREVEEGIGKVRTKGAPGGGGGKAGAKAPLSDLEEGARAALDAIDRANDSKRTGLDLLQQEINLTREWSRELARIPSGRFAGKALPREP